MTMDFSKAIADAQGTPPGTERKGFDPFASTSPTEHPLVTESASPAAFPGVPEYDMEYHSQRFFIGRELREIDKGTKIYDDRDETEQYVAIMNQYAKGLVVITQRSQTILGDGSVVIWLEWTSRRVRPVKPRTPDSPLTEAELKSPARVTPRSVAADGDEKDEDDGPTPNDEPNWDAPDEI